eukprot:CAMPEP_0180140760 /NCGR_PEP_ID=MMETSP0986-20121125/14448_1 /TAXON_ID=697907 /ORGANISM="non described non described, Strain CCMP2293" /LENGTH=38 /DNA_ID= /DNA_START= /DNA_END= /DNA_ORIENTATION=
MTNEKTKEEENSAPRMYTSSAATLKPTWNIRAVGCCDL